jgi:hypothetical protein
MGRPAKGAVNFNAAKKVWEVRVTFKDGTRSKPVAMTGLAACTVAPDDPPKGCGCASCAAAENAARRMSEGMREARRGILEGDRVPLYDASGRRYWRAKVRLEGGSTMRVQADDPEARYSRDTMLELVTKAQRDIDGGVYAERASRAPILEGPFKDKRGRESWRGRIWLADGSKVRVEIPEYRRYSKDSARAHLEYEQEREDTEQVIFNARKQPNGAGTVERRGDIWWVRISLPREHGWEPLQRQRVPIPNSGPMSKDEAQQAGAELSRRVSAGEVVIARPPPLPPKKKPTGFDWSYLRYLEWRVQQLEESKTITEQDVLVALNSSRRVPLRMTALRRIIGERKTGTKTKANVSVIRPHLEALVQKGLVVKCEVPRMNGGEPEAWCLPEVNVMGNTG